MRIVSGEAVRHILNGHGPDAQLRPGEGPITPQMIARYPELIRTPVDVAPTVTARGLPSATYLLRDVDSSLVVVEELPRRVGVMALRTMFRMPRNSGVAPECGRCWASNFAWWEGWTRRPRALRPERPPLSGARSM